MLTMELLILTFIFLLTLILFFDISWLLLFIFKLIVITVDCVTIIFHVIYQRPWKTLKESTKVQAVREDADKCDSPFVRIGDPCKVDTSIMNCSNTIGHLFDTAVDKYGDSRCLGARPILTEYQEKQSNGCIQNKYILADCYSFISYNQVNEKVNKIIAGLTLNGVNPGDKVIFFLETREEFLLTSFAVWKLGAIMVTIVTNLSIEGIDYILEQTKATHMLTSSNYLDKLTTVSDKINHLKVIFVANTSTGNEPIVSPSLEKFKIILFDLLYKDNVSNENQIVYPNPEDVASIIYTSGSTGKPKGVIISHSNWVMAVKSLLTSYLGDYEPDQHEAHLAYLPLAHLFEMIVEIVYFAFSIPICYSSPLTMFDFSPAIGSGCKGDITVIRPTVMAAVPLVLERIKKTTQENLSSKSQIFQKVYQFVYSYKNFWFQFGFETPLMDQMIFGKVNQTLGGNLKMMIVAGAPISSETQQFIRSTFGSKLLQIYGSTEVNLATCMKFTDRYFDRCGSPLFNFKFKLIDWPEGDYFNTDRPHPRGEIAIGGPTVAQGYYMNEEETTKAFWVDENGVRWWRSGDIGEIYHDGSVKIIDRKKDLIKLQHGEYISLGKVESILKNCPYIDNICLYGDSLHDYLIAFILPQRKSFLELAKSLNLDSLSFESLCLDMQIKGKILETLKDFGKSKGLLEMELPKKIQLCSEEWTPDSGLVTAVFKIRRLQIQQFYKQSINTLYLN